MKYAFTTFSCPSLTFEQVLQTARRLGYEGIELRAQSNHLHGVEVSLSSKDRQEIGRRAAEAGVAICCVGTSCKLADPSQVKEQVEIAKAHIELAGDIGCQLIRVFAGMLPATLPRDEAQHTLVEALKTLAEFAEKRDVIVCLESHDSFCNPHDLAAVMSEVNRRAAGIVWDIMHTLRQGNTPPGESFQMLAKWIRHVHVHDGLRSLDVLKMLPIGTGDFDHREILRILKDANYAGFISGEWIDGCMDPGFFTRHLEQEIRTLRRLEGQPA